MSFLWKGWRNTEKDKESIQPTTTDAQRELLEKHSTEIPPKDYHKYVPHGETIEEVDETQLDKYSSHPYYPESQNGEYDKTPSHYGTVPNGYGSPSQYSNTQNGLPEGSPAMTGDDNLSVHMQHYHQPLHKSPFERSVSVPQFSSDDITLPLLYSTISKMSHSLHDDSSGSNTSKHEEVSLKQFNSLHPQIRTIASAASTMPMNEDLRALILSEGLFSLLSSFAIGLPFHKSNLSHAFSQIIERLTYLLRAHGLLSLSAEFSEAAFQISVSDLHARILALRTALTHSASSPTNTSSSFFALPSLFSSSSSIPSPVIYLPFHLSEDIKRMSFELSIPTNAFRLVPYVASSKTSAELTPGSPSSPSSTTFSPTDTYSLDPNALELLIREDKRAGRRPAILVLTIGKSCTESYPYQLDNVDELSSLARRHGLWIHAEGDILPTHAVLPSKDLSTPASSPAIPPATANSSSFAELVKSTTSKDSVHVSPLLLKIQSYSTSTRNFIPTAHPLALTVFISPVTMNFPPKQTSLAILPPSSILSVHSFFASLPISSFSNFLSLQCEFEQASLEFARSSISSFPFISEFGPSTSARGILHLFLSFTSSEAFPLNLFHMSDKDFNSLIYEDLCTMSQSDTGLAEFLSYKLRYGDFCGHSGFIYKPISFSGHGENALKFEQDLFLHFLDCVDHCIQAMHSSVKDRDNFAHSIETSTDLQIVNLTEIPTTTRVGIGAFRYASQRIPEVFHDNFTIALYEALSQLPSTTRSIPVSQQFMPFSPILDHSFYKLDRTVDGFSCIVIDISPHILMRGIPALIAEIEQELQNIRLPENVEKDLHEALKKQVIAETPVSGPAASPRVVYAQQDLDITPEELFSQLEFRDINELISTLHAGSVFTTFFPVEVESDDPKSISPTEEFGLQRVPLFIFYEFVRDEEHPDQSPQGAICWCEPTEQYVSPQQCLPISEITELHLGTNPTSFPAGSPNDRCLSIVSNLITLHMEASSRKIRDDFVLALYHLLELQDQAEQQHQQQQHHHQNLHHPRSQQQTPISSPANPPYYTPSNGSASPYDRRAYR
jgi:hypothetical protein